MLSPEWIRVGGYPLGAIGGPGDLAWSHRWGPGGAGPYEASWSMDLPPTFSHPALRRGQLVEILVGCECVWCGQLLEPDRGADGWVFNARGLAQISYLALDGSGDSTSKPNTAIDAAIARGLPWTRPTSLSGTALANPDITDRLNRIPALLDAFADEEGKTWGVNTQGAVFLSPDPTTPTWLMTPGSGVLGTADDEFANALVGRYRDSGTLAYTTVVVEDDASIERHGREEYPVDMSEMGPITGARATNKLTGVITKGKARLGWTNTLEPSIYELMSVGGVPADPRFVMAGQMVELFGQTDETGVGVLTIPIVLGETVYRAGETIIQLAPRGLADRVLDDAMTIRDLTQWKPAWA